MKRAIVIEQTRHDLSSLELQGYEIIWLMPPQLDYTNPVVYQDMLDAIREIDFDRSQDAVVCAGGHLQMWRLAAVMEQELGEYKVLFWNSERKAYDLLTLY